MAIISISRGTFSGGQAIADCVAKEIGYHCITREELLAEAARQFSIPQETLDNALLTKPDFLERVGLRVRKVHYVAFVRAVLCKMAAQEGVIYSGLAGHLLLQDAPNLIKVKVIADMEYRIKAAMERNKFTREQAHIYIKQVDQSRDDWVKAMYHADRNDPQAYDIVINLQQISLTAACKVVSTMAGLDEFRMTPESQKKMNDLVFASDIRAKIALDGHISDHEIEIKADAGIIHISGTVDSLQDADRLKAFVHNTPGVAAVESHLKIRP
jgi:cytidylate kinase